MAYNSFEITITTINGISLRYIQKEYVIRIVYSVKVMKTLLDLQEEEFIHLKVHRRLHGRADKWAVISKGGGILTLRRRWMFLASVYSFHFLSSTFKVHIRLCFISYLEIKCYYLSWLRLQYKNRVRYARNVFGKILLFISQSSHNKVTQNGLETT